MTRAALIITAGVFTAAAVLFLVARAPRAAGAPNSSRAAAERAGDPSGERPGGEAFRIEREGSWVVAVTERAGMLGFLGHRHAVLPTEWTATLDYAPEDPAASSIEVTVPTDAVRIDNERGLELAGLDEGPDPETVAELQQKVLAPANLAAEEHPEIRFVSTAVEPADQGLRVTGEITIRGTTRAVTVPVDLERREGGTVVFTGSFMVKQTEFGIEPESVGGVVNVADPVEVRFRLEGMVGRERREGRAGEVRPGDGARP